MCAVWTDGVSQQHAAEVADLALGLRPGGRPGHQPQQPHLHVSLAATRTQAACKNALNKVTHSDVCEMMILCQPPAAVSN